MVTTDEPMSADPSRPQLCPYCSQVQPPPATEHWRCVACNLYIREQDLGGVDGDCDLDSVSRDYCPWCAFPVAREHSLPEAEGFVCPGCSGSLTVDMLETQATVDAYRHHQLGGAGYLVFVAVLLAVIVTTFLMIL
ncbi:MAG: hypothetical protein CMJ83_05485 [Planctomycetes bacterium]|jgi:hypothetical protein|nr:hypothetical protein [Planctomycetota bacterium]